ncbi:30S ribosomal protein S3 [Candidatus Falkowbacteria bacterium]|nr:30S ribosomal protein S3 [Candidatus Falkowbacteria bacterium]
MGQKVNPTAFRLGVTTSWNSKWFAGKKDYAVRLREDITIRKFLQTELRQAAVDSVEIERTPKNLVINIKSGKPGVIIGRGGQGVEELKKKIKAKFFGNKKVAIQLNIKEVDKPALSARIVMMDIIFDLEKRIPFRRAVKSAVGRVERAGAQGIKVIVGGRLNGAEIARQEMFSAGALPLHTLRANIDYARGAARTIYGAIGVKVWIYKGTVLNNTDEGESK